jgi:hypothetical protein
MLTVAHIAQAAVFKKVGSAHALAGQHNWRMRADRCWLFLDVEILLGAHNGMYLGNHLLHSSININSTSTEQWYWACLESFCSASSSL